MNLGPDRPYRLPEQLPPPTTGGHHDEHHHRARRHACHWRRPGGSITRLPPAQTRPRCLIVDGNRRVGDNWRSHWDTAAAVHAGAVRRAPGHALPGRPAGRTRARTRWPSTWRHTRRSSTCRSGVSIRVEQLDATPVRLHRRPRRGTIEADNVVVATGTFGRTPMVPDFAPNSTRRICSCTRATYRRPGAAQRRPGAGRRRVALGQRTSPTRWRRPGRRHCAAGTLRIHPGPAGWKPARSVLPADRVRVGHVLTRRTPMGRKLMPKIRFHGAPMLRVKRSDLARRGVQRVAQRVDRRARRQAWARRRDDGWTRASIVWCTGFRQAFDWIRLPIVR